MSLNCTRGTVIDVALDPSIGRELMKSRPCIVVQSDLFNRHSQVTIVVPVTGAEKVARIGPYQVRIAKGQGGLTKDSVAQCDQIRVVDETRLGKRRGVLGAELMKQVNIALKVVLDLP